MVLQMSGWSFHMRWVVFHVGFQTLSLFISILKSWGYSVICILNAKKSSRGRKKTFQFLNLRL